MCVSIDSGADDPLERDLDEEEDASEAGEDDDDDDDTEELMRELQRIKKERLEEQARKVGVGGSRVSTVCFAVFPSSRVYFVPTIFSFALVLLSLFPLSFFLFFLSYSYPQQPFSCT